MHILLASGATVCSAAVGTHPYARQHVGGGPGVRGPGYPMFRKALSCWVSHVLLVFPPARLGLFVFVFLFFWFQLFHPEPLLIYSSIDDQSRLFLAPQSGPHLDNQFIPTSSFPRPHPSANRAHLFRRIHILPPCGSHPLLKHQKIHLIDVYIPRYARRGGVRGFQGGGGRGESSNKVLDLNL